MVAGALRCRGQRGRGGAGLQRAVAAVGGDGGFVVGDRSIAVVDATRCRGQRGRGGTGPQRAAAAVGGDGGFVVGDRGIAVVDDVVETVLLRDEAVVAGILAVHR